MAKKKSAPYLSAGEQIAGTVFFLLYLLVLPLAAVPLFRLAGHLLGVTISPALQNTIYYYLLFAVAVLIFHGYLGRTTRAFFEDPARALRAVGLGIVAMYGLNELMYRLTATLLGSHTNLNDTAISAQIDAAPRTTLLIVILLAPFVEEVLFRGLVFGGLKSKGTVLAYAVSCALFAFLHVWQFALSSHDVTYFALMLQYLVPGVVLCWTYDRAGTLWGSFLLHAAVNALSVFALL